MIVALDRVAQARGHPASIVCDNGPEFRSEALDQWAHQHCVTLAFTQPGRPVQNALVESFNGWFRDEWLHEHWLLDLHDAKAVIEAWRLDYNTVRQLGGRTPEEYTEYLQDQLEAVHSWTRLTAVPDQQLGPRQDQASLTEAAIIGGRVLVRHARP